MDELQKVQIPDLPSTTPNATDYVIVSQGGVTYKVLAGDFKVLFQGKDGVSPTIGANGNWYLGTTDTGILADVNKAVTVMTNAAIDSICI